MTPRFKIGDTISFAWEYDGESGVATFPIRAIYFSEDDVIYLSVPIAFFDEGPKISGPLDWEYWCRDRIARATVEEAEADLLELKERPRHEAL